MSRAVEESNRRMLRARDAMDREHAEICLSVGFTSIGTFGRTFQKIVGESPTTYRERAADLRTVPSASTAPTVDYATPFGNHLRIGQPKEGPIEMPDPAQFATENT